MKFEHTNMWNLRSNSLHGTPISETSSRSASEGITDLYKTRSSRRCPYPKQMNPVHNLSACFFAIRFNEFPQSTPRSFK
jgi:hypothetical protein